MSSFRALQRSDSAEFKPRPSKFVSVGRSRVSPQWRWLLFVLLLSDLLCASLAFSFSYWLRFEGGFTLHPEIQPRPDLYFLMSVTFIGGLTFLFYCMGLYRREELLGGVEEYARLFQAISVGVLAIVLASFLNPDFVIARGWLLLIWVTSFVFIAGGRFLIRRIVYRLRGRGWFTIRTAIVGSNGEGRELVSQLRNPKASGFEIVGQIMKISEAAPSNGSDARVLGCISEIDRIVSRERLEELVIASSAFSRDELLRLFELLQPLPVRIRLSTGFFEVLTTGLRARRIGAVPLLILERFRLSRLQRFFKRLLDYGISAAALLLLLPLFLIIAVIVKLDSSGPIIYRRRVFGVNGTVFDAFKFRTMHVDSDRILEETRELRDELANHHKLVSDPRVTRVGEFLRRYSLDELPQLVNVLKGEMSLVGPRMISPAEGEKYGKWKTNLLTVKPGLTGLWQVSGRSDLSYEERVRLDMHYIRNYSVWLDLQILFFQTLPAVIKGKGAY